MNDSSPPPGPDTQTPRAPTASLPIVDPDALLAQLQIAEPSAALRELVRCLAALRPVTVLEERLNQLDDLAIWLRKRAPVPLLPARTNLGHSSLVPPLPAAAGLAAAPAIVSRAWLLLQLIDVFPPLRRALGSGLRAVLHESSALGLFLEAGLPNDRGLIEETTDRLARRFLPSPHDPRDLAEVLGRFFPGETGAALFDELPSTLVVALARALQADEKTPGETWGPLAIAAGDALRVLSMRIAALGLSDRVRARSAPGRPIHSAFHELPGQCDALVKACQSDLDPRPIARQLTNTIAACQRMVDDVHGHLEKSGVSVDVVFRLSCIDQGLDRLLLLLPCFQGSRVPERYAIAPSILATLLGAHARGNGLASLLKTNVRLLAQKIIERTGESGEHYIAADRRQYFGMLGSAAGGGFLTAFTAIIKLLLSRLHVAPFVEGVLHTVNYAASFLLMQLMGFTLATKQPSMTAATLARQIRESRDGPEHEMSGLVVLIARICRSQLAAAVGNIALVALTAALLDVFVLSRFESPVVTPEMARYIIGSVDPRHSAMVPFAALTGVVLWLAGLGAGWLENFVVYRRLPTAIAQHRLGRVFGVRNMQRLARALERNASGIGGNLSLGTLLAMTPVLGRFFGLPLQTPHVTLTTGALTLAVCSMADELYPTDLIAPLCGVAIIGLLNFGVSFALALGVALRARGVSLRETLQLFRAVVAQFFRTPFAFIFPPAASSTQATDAQL